MSIGGKTTEKDMRNAIGSLNNDNTFFPCVIDGFDGSQQYGEVRYTLDKGPANESMIDVVLYITYLSFDTSSGYNPKFFNYTLIVTDGVGAASPLTVDSNDSATVAVRGRYTISDSPFQNLAGGFMAYTDESHTESKRMFLSGIVYKNTVTSNVSNTTLLTKTILFRTYAATNDLVMSPGACVILTNISSSNITIAANANFVTLRASPLNTSISYMAEVSMFTSSSAMSSKIITTASISGSIVKLAKAFSIPASGYVSVKFYALS